MSGVPQHTSIRPVSAHDHAAWLPLWQDYQLFYKAQIPDNVSRESFRRMLDPGEPTFGALAFDRDHAIGLVHWIFHRSNWTIGDYCYLQDLYVRPENRGHGVGRKLIEHVYSEAQKAGCSRVYWLTQESNATARVLYDRLAERTGFIQYTKIFQRPLN